MAKIQLSHLTKKFAGGVLAVDDLELVIPDGSFVALLGPSGCGKTTTMNMISGLEKPTSGEIYFDEQPVTKLPPGSRTVGFVFQNYAIFTHMTVAENLSFGLRVRNPRPSKDEVARAVDRIAAVLGLGGILDANASRLSVNDMQKVALGRSMIVEPAIFLLDEPFSNLDAAFRAYMRAELKQIQHEIGQTMMYVTHDQVEAMSMADHIAVMDLGRLQQYGTPEELYNAPANRFVAGFVGSSQMNFLPAPLVLGERTGANGRTLTLAIRPENVSFVAPGSESATLDGKVNLIEPLGAKDVIHLDVAGHSFRVIGTPGNRPRVGDNVGLAFEERRQLLFEDETGEAVSI
jgi:multiple sugar transport system ATP-binding protein